MRVKALISFSGIESMAMGEVKDIDESIAKDLLRVKYVEEIGKEDKHENQDVKGGNRKKRK